MAATLEAMCSESFDDGDHDIHGDVEAVRSLTREARYGSMAARFWTSTRGGDFLPRNYLRYIDDARGGGGAGSHYC